MMSTKQKSWQLSNVTCERGEDGVATLRIEVPPDAVQSVRERVIKDYSRRLRIAGFRPGHIPPNIVRRNVGDEAIAQHVSDQLVPAAYQQALEQIELQPLDRAQVDELTFDAFDGLKPLQFTARVIVRPDIELGEVKGLPVDAPAVTVAEEDIDQGLEALRAEHATMRTIEGRGAQEGDVLSGELQVFIDGQPRHEEPTRLRGFVLGSSSFVPRIDEQLIGAGLDEERRFNVTYPSDFKDEDLAGQIAEFAVKVTALKERILPEIDEDFAQSVGAADLAALRETMRVFIHQTRERERFDALRSQVAHAAAGAARFEVPGRLLANRVENRIQSLQHELEHRGSGIDRFLANSGQTREEFEAMVRQEVEHELRRELVLDELARREKLEVSTAEVERQYVSMAKALDQPVEKLIESIEVSSVRASILQRKAVDWLLEHATVSEQPEAEQLAAEQPEAEQPMRELPGAATAESSPE